MYEVIGPNLAGGRLPGAHAQEFALKEYPAKGVCGGGGGVEWDEEGLYEN